MTEIRVDVDLAHPPERVWRALTEAHLVTEWLATNRFLLTEDRRFTFRATAIKGLDDLIEGRIVATESARRLEMQWVSVNLHTTVTLTLRPISLGTRLSLVQQGFLGPHGAMRRRLLQRSYADLFLGPFTVTLDRLAAPAGPADLSLPPAGPALPDSKRNDGRAYERIPRQVRSSSAPGLSSPVREPAGSPEPVLSPPVVAVPDLAAGAASAAVTSSVSGATSVAGLGTGGAAASATGSRRVSGFSFSVIGRLAKAGLRRLRATPVWTEDRRSQTVAASTALLLLLAMAALLIGRATSSHPAGPPQVGGGTEDSLQATVPAQPDSRTSAWRLSPDPRQGTTTTLPSPSAAAPRSALPSTAAPSALAAAGPLVATYKTEKTGPSGYDASVTIRNNGRTDTSDWTVVITLPLVGLTVPMVTGAVLTQNGKQFTFTPVDATRTVAPGAAVQFTFQVAGLGNPNACTINDQPCAGVPG